MAQNKYWIAAGVAVVALAASGGYWLSHRPAAPRDEAVRLTPDGLTIQALGTLGGSTSPTAAGAMAYADGKDMTLYTYDKDVEPGKSACTGDCAEAWPAALASAEAKPFGDWSIVVRADGGRQWALRGKPLYTFAKEARIGDDKGNGAAGGLWHTALVQPTAGMAIPDGIAVLEVRDADGQGLVDSQSMTLYAFDGDLKMDRPSCAGGLCANHFVPMVAAELANPVGDFTVVSRQDQVRQWAYRGKPLYTFDGDREPGDANGKTVDGRWQVAMLFRYFRPPEIAIQTTAAHGAILVDATGKTLYRRDAYRLEVGGHGLRDGGGRFQRPDTGRDIGTKACDADCLKVWHPIQAAPGAQSSGYWDVVAREDGTRQWAYKGYPLYTYDGDKKPGDVTGNDIYDYLVYDGSRPLADNNPHQMTGARALYWAYATP